MLQLRARTKCVSINSTMTYIKCRDLLSFAWNGCYRISQDDACCFNCVKQSFDIENPGKVLTSTLASSNGDSKVCLKANSCLRGEGISSSFVVFRATTSWESGFTALCSFWRRIFWKNKKCGELTLAYIEDTFLMKEHSFDMELWNIWLKWKRWHRFFR